MKGNGPPNGHNGIVIENLVKRFANVTAVNGFTFDIKQGELFGLLGPNGASKTTSIRILCGLFKPAAGSAHIFGLDVVELKRIGYR